jgi:outer membrane protein
MRRRLMVWSAVVVMAGLVWSGAALAEEVKIGYVDAQAVLDRSKPGQVSKEQLEQYVKSRQQIIDVDEEEIKQLEEELKKQQAVLSPDAQRDKQESLQKKYLSYQKRAGELTKEVQEKRTEVLKEFNRKMVQAVQRVAERGGYAVVFDKESEGGTVLFAAAKMDLTDQVVAELDKMGATEGAAAPKAAPKAPSKSGNDETPAKKP